MKKNVAGFLVASAAFAHAGVQAQEVVTIGHSAPVTGPQAVNGKDNENGARLAVEDLNKKGIVVAGKKVTFKLDSEDDQADPKIGVQIAQKLADSGVVAVLGPYNSGVAIPASQIYHSAGIPMLPVASNPALTAQGFNNIFRIGASDEQLGGTMGEFAAKTLKAKTAAIVDDRTAYGQGVAEQFASVAKAHGIKIVGNEYTNSSATDFLGILTTIKAKNPDVIFFGGYAAQGAPMAKQMRQRGLRAKLLGGDGICSADMGKVAGEDASIVYCAQGGTSLEKTAAGRDFLKRYKDCQLLRRHDAARRRNGEGRHDHGQSKADRATGEDGLQGHRRYLFLRRERRSEGCAHDRVCHQERLAGCLRPVIHLESI
jgi:ABC-type branched-subunit amino acid transport system substrate-binding protein